MSKHYELHIRLFEKTWDHFAKARKLDVLTRKFMIQHIAHKSGHQRRQVSEDLRRYGIFLQSRCKVMHSKTDNWYNHVSRKPEES